MYISEDMLVGLATLTHKLCGFGRNVKIFLPARFLLFEYYSGEIALFVDVAPSEAQHVASS